MKNLALYIHFPFCKKKCGYCNFFSIPDSQLDQNFYPLYINALKNELLQWLDEISPDIVVKTLYLGGGTPSLLPVPELIGLLDFFRANIRNFSPREITIECNPATLTPAKLTAYKKSGINRLSLGVQSFDDQELSALGRIHTAAEAKNTFKMIRSAGFDNINIDLMFGIPYQTTNSWQKTLEQSILLSPEHISVYGLTLEKGTALFKRVNDHELEIADHDLNYEMYKYCRTLLPETGYEQYEISNFSKKTRESLHNITYWQNKEYLGLGAAAHSQVNGVRFYNLDDIEKYIKNSGKIRKKSGKIMLSEAIFLELRMVGGINLNSFNDRYGINFQTSFSHQIKDLQAKGLLEHKDGFIRLTDKGIYLANQVFMEFL
jgi:putative oxygen-independent coproporphyrinogen III oxidase